MLLLKVSLKTTTAAVMVGERTILFPL